MATGKKGAQQQIGMAERRVQALAQLDGKKIVLSKDEHPHGGAPKNCKNAA
jgi:hypothetical protein